jgi:glutamyl-tRNA synthetase
MSKRKSQTAIGDYIEEGFVREGLVNYLALLGWSSGTEEEVLGLDELVERFDLRKVQKGGAKFDRERLEWLNGQWIRRLPPEELIDRLRPFLEREVEEGRIGRRPTDDEIRALLPVLQERLPRLGAVGGLIGFLFVDRVDPPAELLVPKRWDAATALDGLRAARDAIAGVGDVSYEADELEPRLRGLAEELEGRRPVHDDPRGRDRPHRGPAAVRHARRARPAADARPARRRDPDPRGRRDASLTCLPPVNLGDLS